MACEKYEELLQAFFDQSLDKPSQRNLKQHLDQCSDCRLDFILYKNVFETLDELPEAEAPDISGEILRIVEQEPIRPPSAIMRVVQPTVGRFDYRWALGLAACVLLAIGAFWGGPGSVEPLPQPLLTAALDTSANTIGDKAPKVQVPRDTVKLVVDGQDVSLMRNGTSTWRDVSGDVQLGFGDRIRTGKDTKALLFYRDSGRLKVLPNTDMQILAQGVRLKYGGTWIKIFKKGTKFAAETPNAVASVRGTVYTVQYDEEALSTKVNLFSTHNPTGGGVLIKTEQEELILQEGTCVDVVIDDIEDAEPIPLETYLAFNHLPPEEVVLGTQNVDVDVATETVTKPVVTTVDEPVDAANTLPVQEETRVNVTPVDGVPVKAVTRPKVLEPMDKGEFFDSVKNR